MRSHNIYSSPCSYCHPEFIRRRALLISGSSRVGGFRNPFDALRASKFGMTSI